MENTLTINEIREKLIKIENGRKGPLPSTEYEIKAILSEIDEIDNGDFYKTYKSLLNEKLMEISH